LISSIRILSSRALSACGVLPIKELFLIVTLIDANSGVQHLAGLTGNTDSGPILCPLFACEAVAWARLAFQSKIIEPLADWTCLIQNTLSAIVKGIVLGYTTFADGLAFIINSAILAIIW
jgi:hypothetical protein